MRLQATSTAIALSRVLAISALALCLLAVWAGTALAAAVNLSLSSDSPALGTPITATVSTEVDPNEQSGGGFELYVVAQSDSAGGCEGTYAQNEQAVGLQAGTVLDGGSAVPTGSSSRSYTVAEYSKGWEGEVCAWLTGPGGGGTSAAEGFTIVDTNTISMGFSKHPHSKAPLTVTLRGYATPIDQNGDGPYLYVIAQPISAGRCRSTYGDDELVVGSSRAKTLDSGDAVSVGRFSSPHNFVAKPGLSEICAWLETAKDDYANSGTTSSSVLASAGRRSGS